MPKMIAGPAVVGLFALAVRADIHAQMRAAAGRDGKGTATALHDRVVPNRPSSAQDQSNTAGGG